MRSGTKSLVEGLKFLEAVHSQILNVPDPNHQKAEVYGVMCPRWAAAEGTSEADAKQLMVDVVRRRAMQSVPIKDAIVVLRELLKEHGLSQSIPASELGGEDGSQA
jgi:hypothetical protein